jgi:transposase
VVLSVDEKTQIQALDRTQPLLPIDFGLSEKRTHDYQRHGTTNLFAALNTGTGEVFADCHPRRTAVEFLAFVKRAVKPHAGKEIHVVLDNLSTHDTPEVRAWLAANPNVSFHFTSGRIVVDQPDRATRKSHECSDTHRRRCGLTSRM